MALSGMVNLYMVKGFLSRFNVETSIQLYGGYIILGLLGSAFFYEPAINEEFKKKSNHNNAEEGMDENNTTKNNKVELFVERKSHQKLQHHSMPSWWRTKVER